MPHRRKTLRSFYCEEELWQALEKLSVTNDRSVDLLINDALVGLLDNRNPRASANLPSIPNERPRAAAAVGRAAAPAFGGGDHPTLQRMPAVGGGRPQPPRNMTPPPMPAAAPPPPPPRPERQERRSSNPPAVAANGLPPLFVHFDGRSYPVSGERFVIGRGTRGTDLTIRDGNISRTHAAVVFHSGNFYIQDLGSTNGIEYRGSRIDTKRIQEGDIIHICDYELTFSFKS